MGGWEEQPRSGPGQLYGHGPTRATPLLVLSIPALPDQSWLWGAPSPSPIDLELPHPPTLAPAPQTPKVPSDPDRSNWGH